MPDIAAAAMLVRMWFASLGTARGAGVLLVGAAVMLSGISSYQPARSQAAGDPVIVAAGDIACSPRDPAFNNGNGTSTACRAAATAKLIGSISPAALLPLGDEQLYCGLVPDFQASYAKSWGAYNSIAHPVPGNHEYARGVLKQSCAYSHAEGYFSYFGSRAGPAGKGYYSYNIGSWHLIALNSQCNVVSCAAGSAQETWLKHDLAGDTSNCTLAYFHEPLFSSATGAQESEVAPLWRDLYAAHADLILNGHAHNYERFAQQSPTGSAGSSGIREIVVGTGGVNHGGFTTTRRNSEKRNSTTFGVLKVTLHPTSYSWQFVPIAGQSFTDSGTTACHA